MTEELKQLLKINSKKKNKLFNEKGYTKYIPFLLTKTLNMEPSRSTDKLVVMTHIIDKLIDKLLGDKVDKIKNLDIVWKTNDENGDKLDHPMPELKLSFHQ